MKYNIPQLAIFLLFGYSTQIASSFVVWTVLESQSHGQCNPWFQSTSLCTQHKFPRIRHPCTSQLGSSPSESASESPTPDYEQEETLLKVHFVVQPDVQPEEAVQALSKFSQSFPFAAVLPVQPMQYLPADDGGVEIKFLRKKTDIKSGIDGGIRFFLEQYPPDEDSDTPHELEMTVKRNSVGQSISKIMSEKLIVTSYVTALTTAIDKPSPIHEKLSMTSMFHKWM